MEFSRENQYPDRFGDLKNGDMFFREDCDLLHMKIEECDGYDSVDNEGDLRCVGSDETMVRRVRGKFVVA